MKRIGFYTIGGFYFSSMTKEDVSCDQIFQDLLTGKNELIQIANMCFVKKNIAGIVIEDVDQPTSPPGHGILSESNEASGGIGRPPAEIESRNGCNQSIFIPSSQEYSEQSSGGNHSPNAHC